MSDTPAIDMCELGHKFYLNVDMRRCPYCMALGLDSARAELSAANARIAELEKDAARYRWLREHSTQPAEPWSTHSNPESLDDAIDAALRGILG